MQRGTVLSEYYRLRRTNIKDATALVGFLAGFLGSAPIAWAFLGAQMEGVDFVRALWMFFGIVLFSAITAGAAGLGAGSGLGWAWERYHRHRRRRRPVANLQVTDFRAQRLRLVTDASDDPITERPG